MNNNNNVAYYNTLTKLVSDKLEKELLVFIKAADCSWLLYLPVIRVYPDQDEWATFKASSILQPFFLFVKNSTQDFKYEGNTQIYLRLHKRHGLWIGITQKSFIIDATGNMYSVGSGDGCFGSLPILSGPILIEIWLVE